MHNPPCASLYFGLGWDSFASSTVYFPLLGCKWWEGPICIIHSISPLHFSEGRRGLFASSTVCLPLLWVGVGLICIIHSVSPSILGGGGAHLHHPQCAAFYLGESGGRGSFCITHSVPPSTWVKVVDGAHFVSSTVLYTWVEVGEGLICIIHSVSPSTLGGGGGGAHLHHPQCVSLYFGWRWGWGSFASSTVCCLLIG